MHEYGQYCPIALGSEVVADRWTPLILRELVLGNTRFNDIERGLPGISRTLLSARLRHLESVGVLERLPSRTGRGSEYFLTPSGRDLESVIQSLGEWAVRWRFVEPESKLVDPITLTWWMHRRVDRERLPDKRVVIEFNYDGSPSTVLWLVLDHGEPSVCMKFPGFDIDLIVRTDAVSMMRVFSGQRPLAAAREDGSVKISGSPTLERSFGTWFLWSPFAPAVRERTSDIAGN